METVSSSVVFPESGHSTCALVCIWHVENLPQSDLLMASMDFICRP